MKFLTAGESHGKGLLGILDGIPAGLKIEKEYIDIQLGRRQMGYGRGGRMKIEKDQVEIWSGIRLGETIASPIGLIVRNKDWENWKDKMSIGVPEKKPKKVTLPRPGHADLAGVEKFGFDDIRNVLERSSARETTMRVALASVCRKLLNEIGVNVASRVIQIHNITDTSDIPKSMSANEINDLADNSPLRCLDKNKEREMIAIIDQAKQNGDSVGGIFEVFATGLPYGLGSYSQWDRKLQSKITSMLMSVNAFKSIEIGQGLSSGEKFGSEVHDEIGWDGKNYKRFSNNAGGIEGGMSNAMPIIAKIAMKPIPTLIKSLRSVDIHTKEKKDAHKERTDSCAVPAASIIAESMMCIVLADVILEKFGGDSLKQLRAHLKASAKY
ncbi:MAG: chorismate synthase [Candidatus Marinimicrobia bacterium]|nr:chorismate synthase [Candidatus Neomarinimicrobiota bacterium]